MLVGAQILRRQSQVQSPRGWGEFPIPLESRRSESRSSPVDFDNDKTRRFNDRRRIAALKQAHEMQRRRRPRRAVPGTRTPTLLQCPCAPGCKGRLAVTKRAKDLPQHLRACFHCGWEAKEGFFPTASHLRAHLRTARCRETQGLPIRSRKARCTEQEMSMMADPQRRSGDKWKCFRCRKNVQFARRMVHVLHNCPMRRSLLEGGSVEYADPP